jgi:MGT family glycosyltransferase
MAHYAFLVPARAGHCLSVVGLACELVNRGHRITVISGPEIAPLLHEFKLPLCEFTERVTLTLWERFSCPIFRCIGARFAAGPRASLRAKSEDLLQRMPQILEDLNVDGVVADQIIPAAGTAAERFDLPFVTICSALPWNMDASVPPMFTEWRHKSGVPARLRNRAGHAGWGWCLRPSLQAINRYRRKWDLRPFSRIDDVYSPLAQISQLFPEFDFPRAAAPPCFHRVGSLGAGRPCNTAGFPWERLDGRPLIFASLGTIPHRGTRAVYARVAAACAGLDAQLVLARGKWADQNDGSENSHDYPGDPLVVDFAPQPALLERAALLITHAGLNTALEGLSRGVPMVALPRATDQPGVAARIVYSGVGLSASFRKCAAPELRGMVERVLREESFRRRARELQTAMQAAGGVPRAAEIVEQALTTRRPVLQP